MRIVLFGCQRIANDVIAFLSSSGHTPVAVVTHDEPRDKIFDYPVAEYCFRLGIPTVRFDGKVDADLIAAQKPDLIVSAYYRKILPKKVIDLPKLGCINIHPGLLPRDRGPNPTLYNILRGEKQAGTTLHYIDEGMDTGDIIAQKVVEIGDLTGFELNGVVMDAGVEMFKANLKSILDGTNNRVKQDDTMATCNTKFSNNMRFIDWNQPANAIVNHIKAYTEPYPGAIAYSKKTGHVIVLEATVIDEMRSAHGPGYFERINDESIKIQTHTAPILVSKFIGDLLPNTGRFISGVPEASNA